MCREVLIITSDKRENYYHEIRLVLYIKMCLPMNNFLVLFCFVCVDVYVRQHL